MKNRAAVAQARKARMEQSRHGERNPYVSMSEEEIANHLHISKTRVNQILDNAMAKMVMHLESRGYGYGQGATQ